MCHTFQSTWAVGNSIQTWQICPESRPRLITCVRAQDRFLQRRAGGSASQRKRPQPSPARSQQGLGRAPKRPAFTLTPPRPAQHGFHAPTAESGDASDEGETMMLDGPVEGPALATPFRCDAQSLNCATVRA